MTEEIKKASSISCYDANRLKEAKEELHNVLKLLMINNSEDLFDHEKKVLNILQNDPTIICQRYREG